MAYLADGSFMMGLAAAGGGLCYSRGTSYGATCTGQQKTMDKRSLPDANFSSQERHLYSYGQEHVGLLDLFAILYRRWRLIALLTVTVAGLGLAFALATPRFYPFQLVLKVGSRLSGDDITLIESSERVAAAINSAYIPALHAELAPERPFLNAEARAGAEGLVVVRAEGSAADQKLYLELLHQVAARVQKARGHVVEVLQQGLQAQLQDARARLSEIDAEAAFLESKQALLADAEQDLVGKQSQGPVADSSLLVALQANAQRGAVRQRLLDLNARRGRERAAVAELEAKLGSLTETAVVLEPQQLREPLGPQRSLIVALAVCLGLFLGVLAAFWLALVERVRREVRRDAAGADASTADAA